MNIRKSQRWVVICQQCWESAQPGEYFPDHSGWGPCGVCGWDGLTVNAHPEIVRAMPWCPTCDGPDYLCPVKPNVSAHA